MSSNELDGYLLLTMTFQKRWYNTAIEDIKHDRERPILGYYCINRFYFPTFKGAHRIRDKKIS